MELRNLKRTCKDKIENNDIESVFDLLKKHIDEDREVYNDIVKIKRRYRDIQNNESMISYYDKDNSKNQLADALIVLIKNLEESDLKKEELPKDEKQKFFLKDVASSRQNTFNNKIFTNDSLGKTELKNVSFNKCEFIKCNFSSMLFECINFTDCEFIDVTFEKFTFYKVEMYECKIDAKFQLDFSIIKSSFYRSRLENVIFEQGKLIEIDFTSTNLISAKIKNNIAVIRPNFANADLKRAIIEVPGLRSEELFVCRSLEDADLPYTIALEIAESKHVWKLMSEEQIREYNPNDPVLRKIDEMDRNSDNEEEEQDMDDGYSSSGESSSESQNNKLEGEDIIGNFNYEQ